MDCIYIQHLAILTVLKAGLLIGSDREISVRHFDTLKGTACDPTAN